MVNLFRLRTEVALEFTWNDGIFFIHRAYRVDGQFVGTFDSAVPAEEGDTDRSDTFPVHGDLVFNYFAGVCQDKVVKGDLEGGSDSTAWSPMWEIWDDSRKHLPIVRLSERIGGVAIGRC